MSDTESDPQFTVLLDDLEASGAENSDSYSDIIIIMYIFCARSLLKEHIAHYNC